MIQSGIFRQWKAAIPTLIGCGVIILMALSAFWLAIFFIFFAMIYLVIHVIFSLREGPEREASQLIVIIYVSTFILVAAIWFYRDYRENIVRYQAADFIEMYDQNNGYYPSTQTFRAYLKEIGNPGMIFYYFPIYSKKNSKETTGYSLSYRTSLGGIFDDIYYLQKSKTWQYIPDFDDEARELLASEQMIRRIEKDSQKDEE